MILNKVIQLALRYKGRWVLSGYFLLLAHFS